MGKRLLTKSRYKLARECPTKLFYTKKSEYGDLSIDDPFMQALAEGGFQVGELAKLYFPGGHMIKTRDIQTALEETDKLLQNENVVIFEAAFQFKNLFIRVDILNKRGNQVELMEVKAKSVDSTEELCFTKKDKPMILAKWDSYIYDVAFQNYVLANCHPEWEITPYLMMADKSKKATIEGLGLHFFVDKDASGQTKVTIDPPNIKKEDLGIEILFKVDLKSVIKTINENHYPISGINSKSFAEEIHLLADVYEKDKKISPVIGTKCRDCQFKIPKEMRDKGLKSGFFECWSEKASLKKEECDGPFFFNVWYNPVKENIVDSNRYLMKDLDEGDLNIKEDVKSGLSRSQRQWLQIEKEKSGDSTPFIDTHGLKAEMDKWIYPLHFIDFETMMLAIPQHKGRRPYEQTAFQFSHHKILEDGKITHFSEYIETTRAKFPNFDFLRDLKKQLDRDKGTIFRWSGHENTVLNQIRVQLQDSKESDKDELCAFIESITKSSSSAGKIWNGERNMVDLLEITQRFYYHPITGGKNGLKFVLPATLQESKYLQEKWSKPNYNSANFKNHVWINFDKDGKVIDPYKSLPLIFKDATEEEIEHFGLAHGNDQIAEGGAAMMAFAKMQFSHISEKERQYIINGLKKYCELDTLAMVMIFEFFKEVTDKMP